MSQFDDLRLQLFDPLRQLRDPPFVIMDQIAEVLASIQRQLIINVWRNLRMALGHANDIGPPRDTYGPTRETSRRNSVYATRNQKSADQSERR
jgi:hypothetical protein